VYLLIPLLNLIGLELTFLKYPKLIYPVSIIIIIITLFWLYKWTKGDTRYRLAIIISAFLFLLAHDLLFIFLEAKFLIHSFVFLTSFALFIFLYTIYDKYVLGGLKTDYAIENIIGYFNLAVFFFLVVDLFYLDLNTNQRFMWFLGIMVLFILALSYSSLKIFNLISGQAVLYIGVILLVLIEIFWIVNLLPIAVYGKGAIVTLVYYVVLGLTKHYLIFGWDELSRRVVVRYLSISGIGMVLVMLTSRW